MENLQTVTTAPEARSLVKQLQETYLFKLVPTVNTETLDLK